MWLIRERLYLGDYRSGRAALGGEPRPVAPAGREAPFAGVVSLCPVPLFADDAIAAPRSASTRWLLRPIADGGNGEEEFEATLAEALPFIDERMDAGNVLVHCAAGMSRSVSVIAAHLCARGMGVGAAYESIAEAKARALANQGFEAGMLVAPAVEFRSCLVRLYDRR